MSSRGSSRQSTRGNLASESRPTSHGDLATPVFTSHSTTGIDFADGDASLTDGSEATEKGRRPAFSISTQEVWDDGGSASPSLVYQDEGSFGGAYSMEGDGSQLSVEMDHQSWGDPGFNMQDVSLMEFSEEESLLEKDLRELSSAYDESQFEIVDLEKRVKNRTKLLEMVRTAYLKDVVTLKHILYDVLTTNERRTVIEEYNSRLPSVDLRAPLEMYGPKGSQLRIKPCVECGGVVDVTLHDSEAQKRMLAALSKYRTREEKLRVQIATADARYDREMEAHRATKKANDEEKKVLYAEMRKINEKKDKFEANSQHQTVKVKEQRDMVAVLREQISQLEQKEKRLGQVEVEMGDLRQNLAAVTQELSGTQKDCSSFKAKLHSLESKLIPDLRASIAEKETEVVQLQTSLSETTRETTKYRDLSAFLEKAEKEKDERLASLQEKMEQVEVEKQTAEETRGGELLLLQDEAAKLRDELRATRAELRETQSHLGSTSKMLEDANAAIVSRDATILQRDHELMDSAAEMEALEEELAAMKQFLSDTISTKKTPSRSRRTRERVERGGSEDQPDEAEIIGIEHPSMKFTWAADDEAEETKLLARIGGSHASTSMASTSSSSSEKVSFDDLGVSSLPVEGSTLVLEDEAGARPSRARPTRAAAAAATAAGGSSRAGTEPEITGEESVSASAPLRAASAPRQAPAPKETAMPTKASPEPQPEPEPEPVPRAIPPAAAPAPAPAPAPSIPTTATTALESAAAEASPSPIASASTTPSPSFAVVPGVQSFPSSSSSQAEAAASLVKSESSIDSSAYELGSKAQAAVKTKAAKKAHKHEMPTVASDPDVDLLPPSENATPCELMLRDSLTKVFMKSLGTKGSKKALNAGRDIFALYGRMLTGAVRALWNALLLSKRGLDFMTKVKTISDGILSANRDGIKSADIGLIMSDVVPMAGAGLGSKLTTAWMTACELPEEMSKSIVPQLDKSKGGSEADGSGVIVWREYTSYFGTTEGDHAYTIAEASKTISTLTSYADALGGEMSSSLVKVLRTWCDSKSVVADLPETIANAQEQTRAELAVKVEGLVRDLMLANGKIDSQKDFIKTLEAKIENLTKRVLDLAPFPELVAGLEAEIERLKRQKAELEATVKRLEEEYWNLSKLNDENLLEIVTLSKKIEDLHTAMSQEAARTVAFEQSSISERALKELAQQKISEIEQRAEEVSAAMTPASTQTFQDTCDGMAQTDFLPLPMSLRAVAARGIGKYERQRPFGVTVVRSEPAGTSYDILQSQAFMNVTKALQGSHRGPLRGTRTINAFGEVELTVSFAAQGTRGGSRPGTHESRKSRENSPSGSRGGPHFGADVNDDLSEYTRGRSSPQHAPGSSDERVQEETLGGGLRAKGHFKGRRDDGSPASPSDWSLGSDEDSHYSFSRSAKNGGSRGGGGASGSGPRSGRSAGGRGSGSGSGSARRVINPIEEISSRLLRDSVGDPASLSHSPLGTPLVVPHSPHGQGGINSNKFLRESPLTRESRASSGLFVDNSNMLDLPVHFHSHQEQQQEQQQQLLERKGSFGSFGSEIDIASFISETSGVSHSRDFDDSIGSLSGPRDRRGQDSNMSMSMSSSSLGPQAMLNVGKARVPRKAIPQILHSTLGLVAATSPLRGLQQTGMQSIRPSGIAVAPSGAATFDEGPSGGIGVRSSVGHIEAGRSARDKGSHLKGQGRSKQPGAMPNFAVGPSSQNQQLR